MFQVEKIDVSGRDGEAAMAGQIPLRCRRRWSRMRPGSTDEDSTGGFSIQKWDGHPLVTWAIGWISFPHHPLMGPKMAMKKRNCQGLDV